MGSRPAWFHFNDTQIEPFDPDDIPRACFGGYEASNQWSSATGTDMQQLQPMQHSAYMLFYERCDVNEARKSHPISMSRDSSTEETLEHPPAKTSPVPQPFLNEVWEDNENYFNERHLFDPDFAKFMQDVVQLPSLLGEDNAAETLFASARENQQLRRLKLVELSTHFLFDALCRYNEKDDFAFWSRHMRTLLCMTKAGSEWILNACGRAYLQLFLFKCEVPEARTLFKKVILDAVNVVQSHHKELSTGVQLANTDCKVEEENAQLRATKDSSATHSWPSEISPSIMLFIDLSLKQLERIEKVDQVSAEFFQLLMELAYVGRAVQHYMLSSGLVRQLCRLCVGSHSLDSLDALDSEGPRTKRSRMIENGRAHNNSSLVALLAFLVQRACLESDSKRMPPTLQQNRPFCTLDTYSTEALTSEQFWGSILDGCQHQVALEQLTEHVCWEDYQSSATVLMAAIRGLIRASYAGFTPFEVVISTLLKLPDSLRKTRVNEVLCKYMNMLRANGSLGNPAALRLNFLMRVCKQDDCYLPARWLVEHRSSWVSDYLLENEIDTVRHEAMFLVQTIASSCPALAGPLIEELISLLPSALQIMKRLSSILRGRNFEHDPVGTSALEARGRVSCVLRALFQLLLVEERSAREGNCGACKDTLTLNEKVDNARQMDTETSYSEARHRSNAVPTGRCSHGDARLQSKLSLLLDILLSVDSLGLEHDESKAVALKLLALACEHQPTVLGLTLTPGLIQKLLSVKMHCHVQNANALHLANSTLKSYLLVLIKGCRENSCFLKTVAAHSNVRQLMAEVLLEVAFQMSRDEIRSFAVLCSSLGIPYWSHYFNLISRKVRARAPGVDSAMSIAQSSETTTKNLGGTSGGASMEALRSSVDLRISKLRRISMSPCLSSGVTMLRELLQQRKHVQLFLEGNGLELPLSLLLKVCIPLEAPEASQEEKKFASKDTVGETEGLVLGSKIMGDEDVSDCLMSAEVINKCARHEPEETRRRLLNLKSIVEVVAYSIVVTHPGRSGLVVLEEVRCPYEESRRSHCAHAGKCAPLFDFLGLLCLEKELNERIAKMVLIDLYFMNKDVIDLGGASSQGAESNTEAQLVSENMDVTKRQPGETSSAALGSEKKDFSSSQKKTSLVSEDSECSQHENQKKYGDTESQAHKEPEKPACIVLPGYWTVMESCELMSRITACWLRGCDKEELHGHEKVLECFVPGVLFNLLSMEASCFDCGLDLADAWLERGGSDAGFGALKLFALNVLEREIVQVFVSDCGIAHVSYVINEAKGKIDSRRLKNIPELWLKLTQDALKKKSIHEGVLGGLVVLAKTQLITFEDVKELCSEIDDFAEEGSLIRERLNQLREALQQQQASDITMKDK